MQGLAEKTGWIKSGSPTATGEAAGQTADTSDGNKAPAPTPAEPEQKFDAQPVIDDVEGESKKFSLIAG